MYGEFSHTLGLHSSYSCWWVKINRFYCMNHRILTAGGRGGRRVCGLHRQKVAAHRAAECGHRKARLSNVKAGLYGFAPRGLPYPRASTGAGLLDRGGVERQKICNRIGLGLPIEYNVFAVQY